MYDTVEIWFKYKPTPFEYLKKFKLGAFIFTFLTTTRNWGDDKKPYHVEFVHKDMAYSSNGKQGVRKCHVEKLGDKSNWIVIEAYHRDVNYAMNYFKAREGSPYDTKGIILSQILDINLHNKAGYFCSELVMGMLKVDDPHRYGIIDVKNYIEATNKIIKELLNESIKAN
jgi:hypothetical protein